MSVTDRHDMTLAVKVALNPNTTNQTFKVLIFSALINQSMESIDQRISCHARDTIQLIHTKLKKNGRIRLLSLFHPSSVINSFPNNNFLDSSKLKEFADNDFEFDEHGRTFSKWAENTMGKEEIACHEQFLLFPTVFSKDLYCRHVKIRACLGKG